MQGVSTPKTQAKKARMGKIPKIQRVDGGPRKYKNSPVTLLATMQRDLLWLINLVTQLWIIMRTLEIYQYLDISHTERKTLILYSKHVRPTDTWIKICSQSTSLIQQGMFSFGRGGWIIFISVFTFLTQMSGIKQIITIYMKLKENMNHEQKKHSVEANPELMQTLVLSINLK